MTKHIKAIWLGAILALAPLAGALGAGMFPGFPAATSTVGTESIPADTGLSGGRQPQTELFTTTQLAIFNGSPIGLTDQATIVPDASQSNVFFVVLGGNRALGTPLNPTDGQRIILFANQDSTGGRALTFNGIFKFPNGSAPTWSSAGGAGAASAVNMIAFTYRAINFAGQGPGWYSESPIFNVR